DHAARIGRETGSDLVLITDALAVVLAAAAFAAANNVTFGFLIEIDCGEHRAGIAPDDPALVAIARAIDEAPGLRLRGVMTHAGHSYGTDQPAEVTALAAIERDA